MRGERKFFMKIVNCKKRSAFIFFSVVFFFVSCQTSLFREAPQSNNSFSEVSVNPNLQNNKQSQKTQTPKDTISNNTTQEENQEKYTEDSISYEPPQIQLPNKTASQTNQPVHYRGDIFIRETKYHKRVKKKIPVLTIEGNVRVTQGSTMLYARKIEILGNNSELILAPNGIKVIDKNTQVQGNYAEYHRNSKKIFLTGNCKVRSKKNQKIEIKSNEMEHDFLNQISYARGDVTTHALPYSGTSKQAMYQQSLDLFRFIGDAFVYHGTTTYHAQEISLQKKTNTIEMKEEVSIWHNAFKDKKKISTNHIVAAYAKRTGEGDKLKTELFSNEKKQLRLTNDDIFFDANYAILYGEQQLEAAGKIVVTDRKEGHRICAEKANSSTDGKIIQFFSVIKKEQNILPRIVLMDEQKNPSVIIKAFHLEKNSVMKKWNARGQMQAEILSIEEEGREHKESVWLGGEWAEVQEGSKDIFLFGNPYVMQKDEKIHSREIIINKDKRSIQLKGSIQTEEP